MRHRFIALARPGVQYWLDPKDLDHVTVWRFPFDKAEVVPITGDMDGAPIAEIVSYYRAGLEPSVWVAANPPMNPWVSGGRPTVNYQHVHLARLPERGEMNRFNQYLNSGFASCRLIARAYDSGRQREIRMYMMPGYADNVGLTDGIDSWVCPTNVLIPPHGVPISKLVADTHAGLNPPVWGTGAPVARRQRTQLLEAVLPQPNTPPARPRRALLDTPSLPTTTRSSRRALL